jgi:mannose-6-phosphate isomerase-like protein (cupin superfamily)
MPAAARAPAAFSRAVVATPATAVENNAFGIRRFHVTGAETEGRLSVWEEVVATGAGSPLHIHHREDETFHVLEGTVRIVCGGESIVAGPGTTATLPRGVPHCFTNVGATTARMLVICNPGGFEGMFIDAERAGEGADLGAVAARYGLEFVEA